ncbi:MAG: flagellar motor stator protein MotA [Paracoccaceae bacterium]|nr:flagellar motor stator protein MotA [Paracoccaceae bacterium]
MIGLVGIAVIFIMVFGGYALAGGKLGVILEALPHEMIVIGGAAVGAFLLSNDIAAVKHTLKDIAKVFKGVKWKAADYRDLLCLLFELIRIAKQSPVLLEQHIEAPEDSAVFKKYPRILADRAAVELICDTLRSASMNYDDPHQVEDVLEKRMDSQLKDGLHSSHALQALADALPALGIVAAVLGVIKTMGSIDQPPEVLGHMIGGALVGTFLGVFLAYGIVGPMSTKLRAIIEEDNHFYRLIREVLVANLHEHPTNICIEVGRQNTPQHVRPSFAALEDALRTIKQDAA